MTQGLVSKFFLINKPEYFYLVFHGLFWGFQNIHAKKEGGFLTLLRFLGITPLKDSLRRYLKNQFFILW